MCCFIDFPNAGSHLESPAEPQREMLPGLSEQDANRALAWFEGNDYNEEELDDEIEAFARSLAADWEVEQFPNSHAIVFGLHLMILGPGPLLTFHACYRNPYGQAFEAMCCL